MAVGPGSVGGIMIGTDPAVLRNQQEQQEQELIRQQKLAQEGQSEANDYGRSEAEKGFTQKLGDFGKFMDTYGGLASPTTISSSSSSGGFGAGGVGGGMGAGTWTPAPVPSTLSLPSPQSTSGQAFARAKDTVGQSLLGLTKALRSQFGSRNISGSSAEMNAIGNTLAQGNQQLADVAREGAIQDTNTANDFAKTQFQGAVTARGQDVDAANAARNAAVAERGQDLNYSTSQQQAQQSKLASILGLWNAFTNGGTGGSGALY